MINWTYINTPHHLRRADYAAVCRDYQSGMAITEIAKRHGISQGAVSQALTKMGFRGRKQGPATKKKEKAGAMYMAGMDIPAMAEDFGVSENAIRNLLRRGGVSAPKHIPSILDDEAIDVYLEVFGRPDLYTLKDALALALEDMADRCVLQKAKRQKGEKT